MKLKNGTRKVWSTLIIKNFREDHFPALNISRLEGSMYIENCSVGDLTGLLWDELHGHLCTISPFSTE